MINMIAKEREALGLSTYAASEKAGINQSTWHRVERLEIDASWETIFAMATADRSCFANAPGRRCNTP